jgi:hypothetical protein
VAILVRSTRTVSLLDEVSCRIVRKSSPAANSVLNIAKWACERFKISLGTEEVVVIRNYTYPAMRLTPSLLSLVFDWSTVLFFWNLPDFLYYSFLEHEVPNRPAADTCYIPLNHYK